MKKALFMLAIAGSPLHADDDRFRELFADPETRTQALLELVPGTRRTYFHTALAHQLAGREKEFQKTIADWNAAATRKQDPISSNGISALETRQLLIDYEKDPETSLDELIRRLGFRFDAVHPDAAEAAMKLPTRLDPSLVTEAEFEKAAAKASKEAPYKKFEQSRLLRELDQVGSFDEAKIRWFLNRLDRADHPGVVPLIARSLDLETPVAFGKSDIHEQLTSGQLTELLKLQPVLRNNAKFNLAYLAKLRPGTETDFRRDTQAHARHLQRCRDHVLKLPQTQNSLKAHVLYHHLRLQRELGNFPKADLLAYLALPQARHPFIRSAQTNETFHVDHSTDFSSATGCPPVEDDRDVILAGLTHFLSETDSAKEFAPFIIEHHLAWYHAKARMLSGADPNKWATSLDPDSFRELQQETRIEFAPGAPKLLSTSDPASLNLDLKNTPDLLIRIYEIDLPSHLARSGREPSVTIDLDGLVPHHQRRLNYKQPPLVLHRETIALPEIDGPGVWLVDLVSGNTSARTLIRKGRLVPFIERTATGQTIRVFDETGKPVTNASVTLGREIHAAKTP